MFIGEAWGRNEDRYKLPLVGASGHELWRMLAEAWPNIHPHLHSQASSAIQLDDDRHGPWLQLRESWLEAASVLFTNVIAARPENNNFDTLCGNKKEVGERYALPAIGNGKYLKPEHFPHLKRLQDEISQCNPNLIIALGAKACWALLGSTRISSLRGVCSPGAGGRKILPTYHPAAVLRNWAWRPIVVVDLLKALREREFKEIIRPERQVLINPTLEEIAAWFSKPASIYSVDIETGRGQIKCIGFARSRSDAIVIPFWADNINGSYWESGGGEAAAWEWVKAALERPIPKLFQNGLYDLSYLVRMGIKPRNCLHDTMLLHHSLHPEMQKGLGFMGSIYSNEASWKLMREWKSDSEKRDE